MTYTQNCKCGDSLSLSSDTPDELKWAKKKIKKFRKSHKKCATS